MSQKPASELSRFFLPVGRAIIRTPTSLFLLFIFLAIAAGTRSVAASRLRQVWTCGVPSISCCFVGAATTEFPRCYEAASVRRRRSSGKRTKDFLSLLIDRRISDMHNFPRGVCPSGRAVAEEMTPLRVSGASGEGVKLDTESVVAKGHASQTSPLQRDVIDVHMHFVFLVHGWLGNDMEMSYIETALANALSSSPSLAGGEDGKELDNVVVHKVRCNNGKTADGIAAGGIRLADEIVETIMGSMEQQQRMNPKGKGKNENDEVVESEDEVDAECHVTFSIVGNSLGGLYARYALSVLPTQLGKIILSPNVFCTTATPHLGVASHTYLPIPRIAEHVIGRGMGSTGRDLFRLDSGEGEGKDLIYRMSTEEDFLRPLSKFRRRIAYANAFRTDFQVPTDTAAFLSPHSAYPHRIDRSYHEEFVATVLHTERQEWRDFVTVFREPSMEDDILTMSTKLDSLGWTKVFVDVRGRIPVPSVRMPRMRRRDSRTELEEFVLERRESGAFNDSGVLVESRELVTLMNPSERLHFPLGHTVMVANSKSDWYAKLNEQGKPVMDMLASDLVQDLLQFAPLADEKDSIQFQSITSVSTSAA